MSKELESLDEEIAALDKFNKISISNIPPPDAYSGLRPKRGEPLSGISRPFKSSD